MIDLNVRTISLKELADCENQKFLDRYQGENIGLLQVSLGNCGLVTLVGIAPVDHYFGQSWWMGQSYANWNSIISCDKALVEKTAESVRKLGVNYKSLPLQLISLSGWFIHRYGGSIPSWNPNVVMSITIPAAAVEAASAAIEENQALISDYLFKQKARLAGDDIGARYGMCDLEKAFPIEGSTGTYYRTMYRALGECQVVQQVFSKSEFTKQKAHLDSLDKMLERLVREAESGTKKVAQGAQREQFFYTLNAAEFDAKLSSQVRQINKLRSKTLVMLKLPHFLSSMAIRRPDVENDLRKSYKYVPNDRDWMVWLQQNSPESFSEEFEELDLIDSYLTSMQELYPCLGTDPLSESLPKLAKMTGP